MVYNAPNPTIWSLVWPVRGGFRLARVDKIPFKYLNTEQYNGKEWKKSRHKYIELYATPQLELVILRVHGGRECGWYGCPNQTHLPQNNPIAKSTLLSVNCFKILLVRILSGYLTSHQLSLRVDWVIQCYDLQ